MDGCRGTYRDMADPRILTMAGSFPGSNLVWRSPHPDMPRLEALIAGLILVGHFCPACPPSIATPQTTEDSTI